jgi:hypothetical protein
MSIFSSLFTSQARAAARDLERRATIFRTEALAARSAQDPDVLTHLRQRPAELGLTEDDVALELEMVDGLIEVLELRRRAALGCPLPVVETSHRALAAEPCHFVAPVFRPDAPGDAGGKLFFTARRLLYLGSPSTSLSWAHVTALTDVDRDLVVRVRPDGVRTFRCNSYVDTLRGAYIASQLLLALTRPAAPDR